MTMTAREAYEAGWRASSRATADLDSAETRFERKHGSALIDDWMDGWVDVALGEPKGTRYSRRHSNEEHA